MNLLKPDLLHLFFEILAKEAIRQTYIKQRKNDSHLRSAGLNFAPDTLEGHSGGMNEADLLKPNRLKHHLPTWGGKRAGIGLIDYNYERPQR